jgi:hypothetical protein
VNPRAQPLVIGVAECVDIPAWKIRGLPAKVDTGARTCALHVENLRELSGGHVRFDVPLLPGRPERFITIDARITRRARVRSTSGEAKPRVFVSARIKLGPVERQVEVGLVDRRQMQFPMLIGRAALARAFLVDVSHTYLLTGKPKSKKQRELQRTIAEVEQRAAKRKAQPARVLASHARDGARPRRAP